MTSYADVQALPVVYLELPGAMANRIPRGDVTLYAGEGQIGKGTSLVWMAVATAIQGNHVAVVFPEDDPETAVRPRLEAALHALAGGLADDPEYARDVFSRIHDLTTSESGAPFVLDASGKTAGSIPSLRQFADNPTGCECPPDPEHRHPVVRLVVVDPMLACVEGSVATNLGARRVLGPLMAMAKETGAAVILSQHVVMLNGKPKVAGSQGLTDTVRLCYMITVDRYNAALRVVKVSKSNGVRPDDVRFALTGQPNGFKSVTWLDQEELTARRTAWRDDATIVRLPPPEPAADVQASQEARRAVLAWLDESGGGTAAECAEWLAESDDWPDLDEDEAAAQLDRLQETGVLAQKRRLSLGGLRRAR